MPRSSPITSSFSNQEVEEYQEELSSQQYLAKFDKQMEVVHAIVSDLNQDHTAMQRIVDAVKAHNERQK